MRHIPHCPAPAIQPYLPKLPRPFQTPQQSGSPTAPHLQVSLASSPNNPTAFQKSKLRPRRQATDIPAQPRRPRFLARRHRGDITCPGFRGLARFGAGAGGSRGRRGLWCKRQFTDPCMRRANTTHCKRPSIPKRSTYTNSSMEPSQQDKTPVPRTLFYIPGPRHPLDNFPKPTDNKINTTNPNLS